MHFSNFLRGFCCTDSGYLEIRRFLLSDRVSSGVFRGSAAEFHGVIPTTHLFIWIVTIALCCQESGATSRQAGATL